ncbi:MAG: glycosyltransferase family 4 protein [Acidobacteriota bacterium]
MLVVATNLAGDDGLSELGRQWVRGLAAGAGARVEACALMDRPGAPALASLGAPVDVHRGSRAWFAARLAWRALRGPAPDVVVCLHLHLLPAIVPLLWRGARLLHVLVGIEAWRPLTGHEARVLRRASALLAISAHTAREFARHNPAWPIAPRVLHPAQPAAAAPAPRSPVPPGFVLLVGRAAREERYKGHDLLLDIWPEVRAHVPAARLVCAGGGDDLTRLRGRVRDEGLADAVTFTGAVSREELAALYRDCACVVLPSAKEGFGFVFLEAMAAARAVIAAPGAAEEIVVDGRTGVIVDPSRPEAVRDAVTRLLADQGLRDCLGQAGRERVREAFSVERFHQGIAANLERLSC